MSRFTQVALTRFARARIARSCGVTEHNNNNNNHNNNVIIHNVIMRSQSRIKYIFSGRSQITRNQWCNYNLFILSGIRQFGIYG